MHIYMDVSPAVLIHFLKRFRRLPFRPILPFVNLPWRWTMIVGVHSHLLHGRSKKDPSIALILRQWRLPSTVDVRTIVRALQMGKEFRSLNSGGATFTMTFTIPHHFGVTRVLSMPFRRLTIHWSHQHPTLPWIMSMIGRLPLTIWSIHPVDHLPPNIVFRWEPWRVPFQATLLVWFQFPTKMWTVLPRSALLWYVRAFSI